MMGRINDMTWGGLRDYDQKPEPERDYYNEARMVMDGQPGVLAEAEHLRAIEEYYQVKLIKIANAIEVVKQNVLKG